MRRWIRGRATSNQLSPVSPQSIGPSLRPSSSYKRPLIGTYEMKWKTSSYKKVEMIFCSSNFNAQLTSFELFELSNSKSVCRANELWTPRIVAALLRALKSNKIEYYYGSTNIMSTHSPLLNASNDWVNSLKSFNVSPSFRSGCFTLSRTDRMAWVAQALFIT